MLNKNTPRKIKSTLYNNEEIFSTYTEIIENEKIKIKGDVSIGKYSDEIICIKSTNLYYTIKGEKLFISYFANDGIIVKGKIAAIEFM